MLEKADRLFEFVFETKTEKFNEKKVFKSLDSAIYVIIHYEQFSIEKAIEGKKAKKAQFNSHLDSLL